MLRRLNYTRRKRLAASDALVTIAPAGPPYSFNAALNLTSYSLPETAKVFVEAYRRMDWMRFDFGTVGSIVPAADRRLVRFEAWEGVLFRVRVVSPDGSPTGKLLAEADRLRPRSSKPTEQKRRSLLPLDSADLNGELFRLDLSEGPVLLVERTLGGGDWRSCARDQLFQGLVYPSVLRQILQHLLSDDWPEEGDPRWERDWARFVESVPGFYPPPDEDGDQDAWTDAVVASFARQHRFVQAFNAKWTDGGSL